MPVPDLPSHDGESSRPNWEYEPAEPRWEYEEPEHRETTLRDSDGKRIGFVIHRSFLASPGYPAPHVRWVSVTKEGEWIRNDNHTFHATREDAEAAVETRIQRSLSRYQRLYGTGKAATAAGRLKKAKPKASDRLRPGRAASSPRETGCLLSVLVACTAVGIALVSALRL